MAYQPLTLPRAAIALILGAMLGGPLTITVMLAPAIIADFYSPTTFLAQFAYASIAATVVFAVGLLFLATPCWVLLHRLGHRSWRSAAILGGALGFGVTFLLYVLPTFPIQPEGSSSSFGDSGGALIEDNVVTLHGWATFAGYSLLIGVMCAGVGLFIWRLAYRRQAT